MRVSDRARKINRHGGAIFIHEDWREEKGIDVRIVADIPQWPIAPIEIRDFVYGRLIDISPATLYRPDAGGAKQFVISLRLRLRGAVDLHDCNQPACA